jgi:hypothetical protein
MKTSTYSCSSPFFWIAIAVAILASTRQTGVVISQNITDDTSNNNVTTTIDDNDTGDDDGFPEDMTTIMPSYPGGPINSPSGTWAVVPAPNEPATAPIQSVPNPTEVPVAAPVVDDISAPSETQPSEVVQPVFEAPVAPAPISGAAIQLRTKASMVVVAAAVVAIAAL